MFFIAVTVEALITFIGYQHIWRAVNGCVLAGAAAFALTMGGICALVITIFMIIEIRRF